MRRIDRNTVEKSPRKPSRSPAVINDADGLPVARHSSASMQIHMRVGIAIQIADTGIKAAWRSVAQLCSKGKIGLLMVNPNSRDCAV